jgi:hypothetical protein
MSLETTNVKDVEQMDISFGNALGSIGGMDENMHQSPLEILE